MKVEDCPGLTITVMVDGVDLPEYAGDIEDDEEPTERKRYVEVVPGSRFAVSMQLDRNFKYHKDAIEASVFLDGKNIVMRCPRLKDRVIGERTIIDKIRSFQRGEYVKQRFQFAALSTSISTILSEKLRR